MKVLSDHKYISSLTDTIPRILFESTTAREMRAGWSKCPRETRRFPCHVVYHNFSEETGTHKKNEAEYCASKSHIQTYTHIYTKLYKCCTGRTTFYLHTYIFFFKSSLPSQPPPYISLMSTPTFHLLHLLIERWNWFIN